MGTLNVVGIAGLNASLKWIQEKTIETLALKEKENRGKLLEILSNYDFIRIVFQEEFSEFFTVFDMQLIAYVLAGVVALGALICWISTLFVINKLVSLNNDDLYY